MTLRPEQLQNLKNLNEAFTEKAFKNFSENYWNGIWHTSIGGFAASVGIAGLEADSSGGVPSLEAEGMRRLLAHDATNYIFGADFGEIFYHGEDAPASSFHDAKTLLMKHIWNNTPEEVTSFSDIVAKIKRKSSVLPERAEPADETLKLYDTEETEEPSVGYASPGVDTCGNCNQTDEVQRVNPALDPHNLKNYNNHVEMFHDDHFTYDEWCVMINEHVKAALQSRREGTLHIQCDTHPQHVYFILKALQDYSDKGYDVYANLASTRLLFFFR